MPNEKSRKIAGILYFSAKTELCQAMKNYAKYRKSGTINMWIHFPSCVPPLKLPAPSPIHSLSPRVPNATAFLQQKTRFPDCICRTHRKSQLTGNCVRSKIHLYKRSEYNVHEIRFFKRYALKKREGSRRKWSAGRRMGAWATDNVY